MEEENDTIYITCKVVTLMFVNLTLSNIHEALSLISITISIGYVLWKWYNDFQKSKVKTPTK